ncbi:DUF1800 domain-containing protein [Sporichthya polymorpha]|uniref:DUF1800 domain-containing protein n=1 Tax=Sporichthya polymorpha TaxID=35751 RepID=UPI00037FAD17|nr:DUF1800 domain-containing protein [Sporichthya polymorpha]
MTSLLDRRNVLTLAALVAASGVVGVAEADGAEAATTATTSQAKRKTKKKLTPKQLRARRRRQARKRAAEKARKKKKPAPAPAPKPTPTPTPTPTPAPSPSPSPSPLPATDAFTLHLLRRATFGITPELLTDVTKAGGAQGWLDQQLNPSGLADVPAAVLGRWPLHAADPPVVHAAGDFGHWKSMEDLVRATVARQLWSKRQLFEVMVDFWSNHLNITCPSSEVWSTKAWDDRNVIRKHALGRFEDMLTASMTSPAMLLYLDNATSRGAAPNENYARELLELHTVGVDAGYGRADILGAARALSGLTVWDPWNGGNATNVGTFRYNANWHYVGKVTVLGWSHANATKNDGPAAAASLATYLARHPATAERIAAKLAVRFVSDTPPAALVERLARVYLDNNTAIVPVLRALFASAEFAAAAGKKVRRPLEDLIAAWRAVGVQPNPLDTNPDGAVAGMRWMLMLLGHAPLGWAPPNGYPDVASAWGGAGRTLNRWNAHIATTQQWWPEGVKWPDLADHLLDGKTPATRGALIDTLIARLLPGISVSTAHRNAMLAFLGADGRIRDGDTTWLFPVLVAVVLDSPYWSIR